jgi:uncharacterized protein (TIGR02594 family)
MRFYTSIALGFVALSVAGAPALCQSAPQQSRVERLAATEKPIFGWPVLVQEARKYMGTNPTDRKKLWCATFMNFILAKAGYAGTHSDAAKSFAYYGRRVSEPRIGAIAVLSRGKRGGHVGVVSGIDAKGNPIIISGNHNRRVGEAIYPRSRVIAYVMPTQRMPVNSKLAGRVTYVRAGADGDVDSPIAELIAAIEADYARSQRPAAPPAPPPPPPVPHLTVQQMPAQTQAPAAPHRLVQQAPDRPTLVAPDVALQRAMEFLGLKDRDPPPPRERRVEQMPGRVASDVALAGQFSQMR